MATELPKFLQRFTLGRLGAAAARETGDSPSGDVSAPSGTTATVAEMPAKPAAGIFLSQPPVLLGQSGTAAVKAGPVTRKAIAADAVQAAARSLPEAGAGPSATLERARSQGAARQARKPRAAKPAVTSPDIPANPAGPGLRIVSLARLAQGGRWRTEAMRSYSVPLLLWFTRGQGRITMAGVTRGFGAHNCLYLPPGTMHGFEVTSQIFGSAVFFPAQQDDGLPETPVHLRFREAGGHNELTQMIDVMQRELDGNRPARERALKHHAGLLSVWLERQIEAQTHATTLTDTGARRLSAAYAALIEQKYHLGLTVADFAAELGVTPTHLSRSCNSACGQSAHELLSNRIFYEARKRLSDGTEPVKDIAGALGFTSAAYFTRAFLKATGQTPSAFRQSALR